jgi:KDO2-lipid IV(A) lauroyltransferase
MRRLVRRAFAEHARYYLELLRASGFRVERQSEHLQVENWEHWEEVLKAGVVVTAPHMGNLEPFGAFVARHGIRALAPIEEIRPPELFEFLASRRGAGNIRLVPVTRARRAMLEALRRHEVVALVADRDLAGDGIPVTLFDHPTTLPSGPAALAVHAGAPLVVAACVRAGPDRLRARAWDLEVQRSGDRRADVAATTAAIARRFEEAIGSAPEQWWGAFQPIWSDQRRELAARSR